MAKLDNFSSYLNNDSSMFSDKPSNGGAEKGNASGDNGRGTGKATNAVIRNQKIKKQK